MKLTKTNNTILENIISVVKAVSKNENVKIEFIEMADNFFAFNQDLVSVERLTLPKTSALAKARGLGDLSAAYFLFHNNNLHNQLKNYEFDLSQEEKSLFDDFEKMRVTAMISKDYEGVKKNILEKIFEDVNQIQFLDEKQILSLSFLSEALKMSLSFVTKEQAEKWIPAFAGITATINSQSQFANEVKNLIEKIRKEKEAEKAKEQKQEKEEHQKNDENEEATQNQENIESDQDIESEKEEEKINEEKKDDKQKQTDLADQDAKIMQVGANSEEQQEEKVEFKPIYKVFSNKYDEIILPEKLISKNELELLRYSLDLRIAKLNSISKRLTLKLKRKLMAKKNHYIEQGNLEGILDRKRFSQLIVDPFSDNLFIKEKQQEFSDTIVSILLDNSGSMRGQPIVMSALASEIIASILEKFSIKSEILGFTTVDWRGGRSRKAWELQGRTPNPGRLSDLRHIIYKSANSNFKKSSVNLGLMLKEGLLKENIDGEALLWAKARLMQREEKRKILLVISDGTPVDDSTNSTNDSDILSDHLHHTIKTIEKQKKIEIVGIGIGHHVSNFYANSISIKSIEDLGDVMIEKISNLI